MASSLGVAKVINVRSEAPLIVTRRTVIDEQVAAVIAPRIVYVHIAVVMRGSLTACA